MSALLPFRPSAKVIGPTVNQQPPYSVRMLVDEARNKGITKLPAVIAYIESTYNYSPKSSTVAVHLSNLRESDREATVRSNLRSDPPPPRSRELTLRSAAKLFKGLKSYEDYVIQLDEAAHEAKARLLRKMARWNGIVMSLDSARILLAELEK